MEDIQCYYSNHNQNTFKTNKHILIAHDRALPPFRQLRNSKGASPKDTESGKRQGPKKSFERARVTDFDDFRTLIEGGFAESTLAMDGSKNKVD
jgi:hypothetical protein